MFKSSLYTLRGQLIFSVAVVHAVLMTMFIWDLTERQKNMLLESQTDHAVALAQSIATSSAGWVVARDLYGLQEIISAQSRYPELLFAMIVDVDGRVLAHTEIARLGQYLDDLPASPEEKILSQSPALVDVISPVILANNTIGWVRIGLGREATAARMATITRDGIIYALIAIIIGSIMAWYLGTRVTKKLHAIQSTADAIVQGDKQVRTAVQGKDEISHVALAFNKMLDSLALSHRELEISEERFNLAIHASNGGLWDWDIKTQKVYYSPRWKEMLGYKETELENVSSTWESMTNEDDKLQTLNLIQDCMKGNATGFNTILRMKHKDGHWLHINSRGTLVSDKYGKPLRFVGIHTDISDQKAQEEIIWHQANYDALTELPNRVFFQKLLDSEIKQSKRKNYQLWVLFLDLDGFKNVNDSFGHDVGDELLIEVSQRIQKTIRESDIVVRLGGDEFVVILPDINEISNVDRIASNIIDSISQKFILHNEEVNISISIGIANYPNDARNSSDLLKYSDQSMYKAKQKGKNQYVYFEASFQYDFEFRIKMSNELREAILKHELLVYYQPIVDLGSGEIYKAEALVRWRHPENGLLSPGDFIALAEDSGSMCEVGIWVFNHVFKQLGDWQSHFKSLLQISINMSLVQLKSRDEKYNSWLQKFKANNIDGSNIIIEITEDVLIKDEPTVNKKLLKYHEHGIQLAIDGFGMGYSSLSLIKEFDIDYLKIDQSFIRGMTLSSEKESLSRAIIMMAHELGLKVIAAGVETEQQKDMLKAMNCDFAQGYFFSKPLAAEQFENFYIH